MKKTIRDVELNNKVVLMRVDFNVPMKDGKITDENRIIQALPTIQYALDNNAKIVLLSHLGRVKEEADLAKNDLAPVAVRLSEKLNKPVKFVNATRGAEVENAIKAMNNGDIVMLQNTRYEDLDGKKESKNDPELGAYWAGFADVFVNDAFGTAHRAHASNSGIAAAMKAKNAPVVAGFLMEKEIKFIGGAVDNPVRPFVAILGGAKVSDKIGVIESLIQKADKILICGAMAYTFYKAKGYEVGTSKCELDFVDFAKSLLEKGGDKIVLPVDTVVTKDFPLTNDPVDAKVVPSNQLPADMMGLDIGPKTLELFKKELEGAKTVVWNGPAGVFELDQFAKGTNGICELVAHLEGATTIIGGGDSAAAAIKLGYEEKFTHISTGGGASLEYLEGKVLPGVDAIDNKRKPIIAGNWKMYKNYDEAIAFVKEVNDKLPSKDLVDSVICAQATALKEMVDEQGENLRIGAQNVHFKDEGAYTGELSTGMLTSIGVSYVVIGHSERRTYNNDTDSDINLKVKKALDAGLTPIMCCGEHLEEREGGKTEAWLSNQIALDLAGLTKEEVKKVVIAYEPIWAIGTGKTATPEIAEETCKFIRTKVAELFDKEVAEAIRIQYGGSVKVKNIKELMAQEDIDGALIGGASLVASDFITLVEAAL